MAFCEKHGRIPDGEWRPRCPEPKRTPAQRDLSYCEHAMRLLDRLREECECFAARTPKTEHGADALKPHLDELERMLGQTFLRISTEVE